MAELPLITVITVCHNDADVVEQTIRSVLEQQYPRMNYIIWDGCSTDTTLDIVKRYDEQLTYWTSEPNNGTYDAMNRATKKSHRTCWRRQAVALFPLCGRPIPS